METGQSGEVSEDTNNQTEPLNTKPKDPTLTRLPPPKLTTKPRPRHLVLFNTQVIEFLT